MPEANPGKKIWRFIQIISAGIQVETAVKDIGGLFE